MSDFKSLRTVVFKSTDPNSSLLQENEAFRRSQGRTPREGLLSPTAVGSKPLLSCFYTGFLS